MRFTNDATGDKYRQFKTVSVDDAEAPLDLRSLLNDGCKLVELERTREGHLTLKLYELIAESPASDFGTV